jgi:PAS domain S-box-containing protein
MSLAMGPLDAGLQSVLDTALDAVVVMGVDGQIIGWNGVAEQSFGWSGDEAKGRQLSDLIIPRKFRDAHQRGLSHYLATGEGPVLNRRIEITGLHRDGHEFPVELSITASEQFGGRLFVGFIRDITERQQETERQRRLLQESDHRVKNMLSVVAAIAQQTARNSSNLAAFEKAFTGRLQSLARAHQLLIGKVWHDVALSTLADQVLGADAATGRAGFGGPAILLGAKQVLGLSMILHELYTNAVKYGALCGDEGRIALSWDMRDGEAELVWAEHGPDCMRDGVTSGFGERMIAMSAKAELAGSIERDWRPEGLKLTLRFPLSE